MARNKEGRPEWFKFWRRNLRQLDVAQLNMESRGIIFTNAMRYFDSPSSELLSMTPVEAMAFNVLRISIDDAVSEYSERAELNRANGSKGGRPPKTEENRKNQMGFEKTEKTKWVKNNPKIEERIQNTEERKVMMADKPPSTRFQAPSLEEVTAYCAERKNNIDPRRFIDFYTANGWTQGRGKRIVDWRAAIRTWERNSSKQTQAPDLSWRDKKAVTPEDMVEYPPNSGKYVPRWEAFANG